MLLSSNASENLSLLVGIVSGVAAVGAFLFEMVRGWNNRFDECARNLRDKDNQLSQLSAAINLRTYISRRFLWVSYKSEAAKLICGALKVCENGHLQKALGDSLSYITKAHGLDLQRARLHQISIKPKHRIEYEITGNVKLNKRCIDLRNSDLFKADLSESTICNVVFDKAVFYETLLYGTTFHNCSFVGAKFPDADLKGTRFFACDLQDAIFKGARSVSQASVNCQEKDKNGESVPLISYLDENGIFGIRHENPVYSEKTPQLSIFLSKLGLMSISQQNKSNDIKKNLKDRYGLTFTQIERTDYKSSGQLTTIQSTIAQCNGLVVLAFAHMQVYNGAVRLDNEENMDQLSNCQYSSPWLQIETAFARSISRPCLIIAEDELLKRNGIFDENIVENDDLMFFVTYKGYFNEEDYKIIDQWKRAVEKCQ